MAHCNDSFTEFDQANEHIRQAKSWERQPQLTDLGRLRRHIREQRDWIEQCGGSLAGYITHYGSRTDPQHSGDGGEAIYAADTAHLHQLLQHLPAGVTEEPSPDEIAHDQALAERHQREAAQRLFSDLETAVDGYVADVAGDFGIARIVREDLAALKQQVADALS